MGEQEIGKSLHPYYLNTPKHRINTKNLSEDINGFKNTNQSFPQKAILISLKPSFGTTSIRKIRKNYIQFKVESVCVCVSVHFGTIQIQQVNQKSFLRSCLGQL